LIPIFSDLLGAIASEASADPRPAFPPGSPEFEAWLLRDLDRARRRGEVIEADELTGDEADPCPLAEEGLDPFLRWVARQNEARRKKAAAA
jgi:hypothetical protein